MANTEKLTESELEQYEKLGSLELLRWAIDRYQEQVALACSFGAEDMVLIDLINQVTSKPRIFTLDTGRLHQETYEVMHKVEKHYNLKLEVHFPDRDAVEEMVKKSGINLFYDSIENRKQCCHVRKVAPLQKKLKTCEAWMTGLRRQQSVTRAGLEIIEWDETHQIIKINPLAEWTEDQIWDYIKQHNIPYNKLHDQGFPSIGCAPCTRAIKPGEDVRAGRWWWETGMPKECGRHLGAAWGRTV